MPLGPALRFPEFVLHVYGGTRPPTGEGWEDTRVIDRADAPAGVIEQVVAEHTGDAPWPERRPAWFRRGWLEEVAAWLETDAPLEPVRVWSLSAVLRVPGAGYLKAACAHFHTEPALTRAVGAIGGARTPEVLATDDARGWMLLAPLPEAPAAQLEDVVATLAQLQVDAVAHTDDLRAAGCPDRGLEATLDAFRALHEDEAIETRLREFFASGVPLSLVHGDLHPGNVAGDVIYDWTDACVSHPFLDGANVLRTKGDADRGAITAAYLEPWGTRDGWDLAPLANRVFQLVTYDAIRRSLEPASQWEGADVAARLLADLRSWDA